MPTTQASCEEDAGSPSRLCARGLAGQTGLDDFSSRLRADDSYTLAGDIVLVEAVIRQIKDRVLVSCDGIRFGSNCEVARRCFNVRFRMTDTLVSAPTKGNQRWAGIVSAPLAQIPCMMEQSFPHLLHATHQPGLGTSSRQSLFDSGSRGENTRPARAAAR